MRVLIACEFSGIVREAFQSRGHDAWSCDLLPTEIPGQHLEGPIEKYFGTNIGPHLRWDLMIAFPPCRYLAVSGARWWKDRQPEQEKALDFIRYLLSLKIPRIALENPVGKISSAIRPPDQYIQPWQFGHPETKKTGFWLKNLPLLEPTNIVEGREPRVHHEAPGPDRWKRRSRTLQGIADAMAEQWGQPQTYWPAGPKPVRLSGETIP